ncbi:SgcJ/EcaC family oxidoreductase [Pedobacter duraquae]|uniref:Uncharacterized protein (TIGR02246 family) n=1 Tax=Pedobacter duraquae TaxID=425511 RepID=A0A4R6IM93_9SPHI|nr:SgcJ/EcaC family oxidoreductase [Pedobacter duraquae]TDO23279.1 uncharacterized protein (TIGR02246 family) [Pedobacter duraquae]
MKKLSVILLVLLFANIVVNAQSRTDDEAAIQKTWARFGNSWKNKDFSDMKDYVTPDCHWINVVGMHWHNLKEVQFAHQVFVNAFLKNAAAADKSSDLRFLTNDVAIMYRVTHIAAFYPPDGVDRGTNKQGDKDNIATIVFVKQNGKWYIASGHNSDVVAQAAASDPVLHMPK